MAVDQGIFKAESNDLPFVIDGKSAGQNYVSGKVGDGFIQVNETLLAGPEKRAGSKTIRHLTDDLPCIIHVKGLTVYAGGIRIQRLHSCGAGPDESAHTSAALGRANDQPIVIDVVRAAA